MAANEDRTALWRTPLSTPLRNNENGFQELFKHSEKLLASSVSICRLKGSVECQTGGIITVCEEMQRLLRLAFNETGRLEKELKKQKQTFDEEISLLKERLAYLEETATIPKSNFMIKKNNERLPLKPSTSENTLQDDIKDKTPPTKVRRGNSTIKKSSENHLTNENSSNKSQEYENPNEVKKQDKLIEEQDKMDEDDSDDLSLEISVFDIPKEAKPKTNSKKASSDKKPQETSSAKGRKSRAKKTILSEQPVGTEEPNKDCNVERKQEVSKQRTTKNSKREKPNKDNKAKESEAKKRSTYKPRKNKIDDDQTEPAFDANDSSNSDVFLNPESGLLEMKECSESSEHDIVEQDTKQKKITKSKPTTANKKKDVTKDSKLKKNTKKETSKKEELPKRSNTEAIISTFLDSPKKSCSNSPIQSLPESPVGKTSEKDDTARASPAPIPKSNPPPLTNESDEVLGDMSFLIDISSMISAFVSGSECQHLELPLMQARERADARKLAGLFNLHISIGNKSDNRSSLILSKTANSQMPRPGKLDSLLSKLSIAATKEAERLSSKARTMKRKVTHVGEDDEVVDNDSQVQRVGKSKNKKAKI